MFEVKVTKSSSQHKIDFQAFLCLSLELSPFNFFKNFTFLIDSRISAANCINFFTDGGYFCHYNNYESEF